MEYVYASTPFGDAREYLTATGRAATQEKMAAIAQEIVGRRRGERNHPFVSGVARSFDCYLLGMSAPGVGVSTLAHRLGRPEADEERAWDYFPTAPEEITPESSIHPPAGR